MFSKACLHHACTKSPMHNQWAVNKRVTAHACHEITQTPLQEDMKKLGDMDKVYWTSAVANGKNWKTRISIQQDVSRSLHKLKDLR